MKTPPKNFSAKDTSSCGADNKCECTASVKRMEKPQSVGGNLDIGVFAMFSRRNRLFFNKKVSCEKFYGTYYFNRLFQQKGWSVFAVYKYVKLEAVHLQPTTRINHDVLQTFYNFHHGSKSLEKSFNFCHEEINSKAVWNHNFTARVHLKKSQVGTHMGVSKNRGGPPKWMV